MEKPCCLIYCKCGAEIITKQKQSSLADSFRQLKIDVFELHDICALSINEKDILQTIGASYKKKLIVACYPRAIENIFLQNNIDVSDFEVLNFRELSEEKILERINQEMVDSNPAPKYEVLKSSLKVPAWYPVIDRSRCTRCGQCARFCVFGVYTYDRKNLQVVNPLSCKNNCPACGRTCPASAIIFPRLPESSALSGADPDSYRPVNQVGKEGLLVSLNERNSARRTIFKQGVILQAEQEKLKAIEQFKIASKKK